MNFKVRKEYFYALFTRACYILAGMVLLLVSALFGNEYGYVLIICVLLIAVHYADKEAEQKEKVTK